jgi:hypothetical protein
MPVISGPAGFTDLILDLSVYLGSSVNVPPPPPPPPPPAMANILPITPYSGAANTVNFGGSPVIALHGPLTGGIILNGPDLVSQGIGVVEPLYVDITGPAALGQTRTTIPLQPGQYFLVPPGQTTNVWVNAESGGHRFTAIALQPPMAVIPPVLIPSTFPPSGPTGLLNTIPSYLYQQYTDDDSLQAFVAAYNIMAQQYVDWFNYINLPIYTGLSGALLDWVAQGLYGIARPALSSNKSRVRGPFNTAPFNTIAFNQSKRVGPTDVTATSDDVFKRILTWHLYKGDGKEFTVQWLKRRIVRFLFGVNGTDYNGSTNGISVTFGVNSQINITLISGVRKTTGGAIFNRFYFNQRSSSAFNDVQSTVLIFIPPPLAAIFQEAINTGVLEMPLQYSVVVTI